MPVLSGQLSANDLSGLVELQEWKVDWGGRPQDPFVDASGNVWFCGQAGNYIARFEPSTGTFKKYQVPNGSNPHNLIVDDKGFVWYAGNLNAHIGKLDPASGKITRFSMQERLGDRLILLTEAEIIEEQQQQGLLPQLPILPLIPRQHAFIAN